MSNDMEMFLSRVDAYLGKERVKELVQGGLTDDALGAAYEEMVAAVQRTNHVIHGGIVAHTYG